MEFLVINGKVEKVSETGLNHLLTDVICRLSQKVWYGHGGIPLLEKNLRQLATQVGLLSLPVPKVLNDARETFRVTKRMLNKNKLYRSGFLHFQIFWKEKEIHSLVTADASDGFGFTFSGNGIHAAFSNQKILTLNPFNRFPFFHEAIWNAGQAETFRNPSQQVIFLNENNALCEGIHANIFLVKENVLLTPALSAGCYEDVLRELILTQGKESGLVVLERNDIGKELIFEMDEIFFASETWGIQWVMGVEHKRFLQNYAEKIRDKTDEALAEMAR